MPLLNGVSGHPSDEQQPGMLPHHYHQQPNGMPAQASGGASSAIPGPAFAAALKQSLSADKIKSLSSAQMQSSRQIPPQAYQQQQQQMQANAAMGQQQQQQQQQQQHYANGMPAPSSNAAQSSATHSAPHARAASNSLAAPSSTAMPTTASSLMREGPRDFTVIKEVGDGSFGTVCLADWKSPLPSGTMLSPMQHPTTRPEYVGKRLVAIKKMKKPFPSWEECIKLKELKSLLAIPAHANIIPLYDAFLMPTTKELHFVFECMEGNLYQLTKSRKGRPLAGGLVASIFGQIIAGLHHIHLHGYFHRDMKPENLLITTTGLADYPPSAPYALPGTPPERDVLVIVKLADFGLARETRSKPPYTEYVSTRWYRAPEVLLRSRDYSNPVDMWALGTILAELVNLKPLFPGQSEVDQVFQICEVLGDPSGEYGADERGRVRGGGAWDRGIKMAKSVGFAFPKVQPITFSSLFGQHVPSSLVECIQDLLRYDPQARLTTQQCLDHPYFRDVAPRLLPPQAKPPAPPSAPSPIRRVPDRMAIDSSSSPMRSIPPSHSQMSASSGKPVFGANSDMQTLPPLRRAQAQNGQSPPHRVPFYQSTNAGPTVQMRDQSEPPSNAGSPMHESSDVQWAPAPAPAMRDSTISQYPAFPDSASMYAGSHASMQFDDRSGHGSNDTSTLYDGSVFEGTPQLHGSSSTLHLQDQRQSGHGQQQHHSGPISPSPSRTVYDDDMTLALERERQGHATDGRNQGMGQYPQGVGSSPNLPSMRDSTSDVSLSNRNDQNASNETVNSKDKDKRRSRGWGLHISSVFSGSNNSNSNSNGSGSNTHNHNHNHSHSSLKRSQSSSTGGASVKGEQTPAQQVVAAHMEASAASAAAAAASAAPAPPMDPKKAKKEAEKAAREAEKAKREAQQKAARERARAVMQKRNQLLAASNNKDEVEWLNTSLLEQPAGAKPYPSEKARGKQPMPQNAQTQYSGMSSGEYPRHSQGSHPDMPYSPSFQQGGNMVGSPSMMSNRAFQHRGTHETRLGRTKARRREFDDDHSMSSFGEEMDPRRISMQSYQTGDSDPGPGKSHLPGHPNYLHRTNSASSLNSAPSLVDPSRFTTSLDSQRSSAETRSISSLDHQLITNMENMTAAEARSRSPGNISPGPIHLVGSRQSVSRQSRGSRASSANRQGSASPLHHQGAPRYHPYSHMAGQPSMSSTQSSSAHSHYNFTLPPLQSIHGATNPDGSSAPTSARSLGVHQQRGISRGSLGSNPTSESSHLPPIANAQPPSPYQQQQMVNPIFQVPSPAGGGGGALAGGAGGGYAHAHAHAHPHLHSPKNPHQPTLPPFSQLAAAADIPLPPSASPTQHVFRRHSPQPGPQGTYDNGRMYGDGNASG